MAEPVGKNSPPAVSTGAGQIAQMSGVAPRRVTMRAEARRKRAIFDLFVRIDSPEIGGANVFL
jgi:hypothetical protein